MGYRPPGIQGWMGENELVWLHDKAAEMESVVEIGSWKGLSTHALLSGCPGPVFAVDHFKGNPNQLTGPHKEAMTHDISLIFWANVGHFPNLVMIRRDSIEAAQFFREKSIDMVFIDGCHVREAITADVKAWMPVCRRLLCGHDLGEVKEALEAMKLNYRQEIGTLWSMEL